MPSLWERTLLFKYTLPNRARIGLAHTLSEATNTA
jgi:hypothetical protein